MRSGIVCAQGGEAAELAELAGLAELLDANSQWRIFDSGSQYESK